MPLAAPVVAEVKRKPRAMDFRPGDIVEVRHTTGRGGEQTVFAAVVVSPRRERQRYKSAVERAFAWVYVRPLTTPHAYHYGGGGYYPESCRLIIRPPRKDVPMPDNIELGSE